MMDVRVTTMTAADDARYCRNMAALFRSDMRLAQQLDELPPDGSVVVEASRCGEPTASVRAGESGQRVHLHSRIDPAAEAARFADAVTLEKNFCFVVSGFGLGHHVKALAARLTGEAFIAVAEPNLQILKAAFEHVDLAELFDRGRCILLTSTDKGDFQQHFEPYHLLMTLGTQFVSFGPGERLEAAFHAQIRRMVADYMSYSRMSVVTLVNNARITCRNIANNLVRYLSTPPIDILRDRFKGCPGVVIAAGPSLRRHIDALAELKGRAVTITVQTTFKTLLDRGMVPDFVTALDFHEMSKRFFEGTGDRPRTHLVAEPKVSWHVLDYYPGPTSVLDSSFARLCLGESLAARDGLKAGATVAHLAFYLAVYMGCDPIILVGQDLAYTNHAYYMPGVPMHELWRPQLNRFCTIENMEWERIGRSRNILLKVKDLHGQDVYTDEQLYTYLQQFEGDFAAVPGRVIDATEGGMRKAGTRVMKFQEAVERYCTEPMPAEQFAYLDQMCWHEPSRFAAAVGELEQRLREVDEMVEICERMASVLEEMGGLLDRPTEFNGRIIEVDALRLRIRAADRTYQMISGVCQQAELQRFRADRMLKLNETAGVELARGQLDRDRRFVAAVIEGAQVLKAIIAEGLDRLREAADKAAVRIEPQTA